MVRNVHEFHSCLLQPRGGAKMILVQVCNPEIFIPKLFYYSLTLSEKLQKEIESFICIRVINYNHNHHHNFIVTIVIIIL